MARRRWALGAAALLGDIAVFAVFPFLGGANHELGMSAERFIRIFVPFAAAWPPVAVLATAYATDTLGSVRRTLVIVPPAWLLAGVAAMIIRVTLFDRPFSLPFSIVALSLTGVLLLAWRLVLRWWTMRGQ